MRGWEGWWGGWPEGQQDLSPIPASEARGRNEIKLQPFWETSAFSCMREKQKNDQGRCHYCFFKQSQQKCHHWEHKAHQYG